MGYQSGAMLAGFIGVIDARFSLPSNAGVHFRWCDRELRRCRLHDVRQRVTCGGGALKLLLWNNGQAWTLRGK